MSKIICDVCGTSYSETATQCPICGCVRPGDVVTVAGDTNDLETPVSGTYNYVKGGRFSKSNVRKRNNGVTLKTVTPKSNEQVQESDSKKNEKPFVIAVIALLLAIIAIVVYIAVRFFAAGGFNGFDNSVTTEDTTASSTEEQTQTTILEIPCVELTLSKTMITFDKAEAAVLLTAAPNPKDTTYDITFQSDDETVATVSADGKVVAVGPGETVITVVCGDVTAQCNVVCTFENPVEETTQETISAEELELNRKDFTLSKNGDSWNLYNGDIPVEQITWTSDDEKVATFKNGVVTAVGGGYTTVHAEYLGVKVSCIVRCAGPKYQEPATDNESAADANYIISDTDVTIVVGEKFTLTLKDKNNNVVEATWASADSNVCSVSGNTVTGVGKGKTVVTTTVEGATYSCIVRIN